MLPSNLSGEVVTGEALSQILQQARENHHAIPAFRCTSSSSCRTVLDAVRKGRNTIATPIQITVVAESVNETVALAKAVRSMIRRQSNSPIPIILQASYHHCCALTGRNGYHPHWLNDLLEANREYFGEHNEPLFSSVWADFSHEPRDEAVAICRQYWRHQFAPTHLWLEMTHGFGSSKKKGNRQNCGVFVSPTRGAFDDCVDSMPTPVGASTRIVPVKEQGSLFGSWWNKRATDVSSSFHLTMSCQCDAKTSTQAHSHQVGPSFAKFVKQVSDIGAEQQQDILVKLDFGLLLERRQATDPSSLGWLDEEGESKTARNENDDDDTYVNTWWRWLVVNNETSLMTATTTKRHIVENRSHPIKQKGEGDSMGM